MNGSNHSQDVEAVLAQEARRFGAQVSQDIAVLEEVLGDDLVYTHSDARVDTKRSYIDAVAKRGYRGVTTRDVVVRIYGDTAVVTGIAELAVSDTLQFTARYTNVWVRRGNWQNVLWQSTMLKS